MKSPQELFRQLEREVRAHKEELPIDTFLPSPESFPSDFSPSSSVAEAGEVRELGRLEEKPHILPDRGGQQSENDPAQESQDTPLSLQDEVLEFMSRNQMAGFEEEEDSDLLLGYDPTSQPED